VVVAVAMVDDGASQLDAGATVYETNYLGISCCIRTTDEITIKATVVDSSALTVA
jgi:hypothetical protein